MLSEGRPMPAHRPARAATPEVQALHMSIEALYSVFSAYPLRPHVMGCPCCVSEKDNHDLHARPLREFTCEHLRRYAFKAMTTWGKVEDFKHFLPRIFELSSLPDGRFDF